MKSIFIAYKHIYVLVGFLTITFCLKAQNNLVPNSSFEIFTDCPKLLNNFLPNSWYNACKNAPAYYNSCDTGIFTSVPLNFFGGFTNFQYAHSGVGYIFIDHLKTFTRFYAGVNLTSPLINNKKYYIEYFVVNPNCLNSACNNVGALLTDTIVYSDPNRSTYNLISANPQVLNFGNPIIADTQNWVKVSSIYIAHGGEQYLTLGNFKSNANTLSKKILTMNPSKIEAGYFIDDVSVIPLDSFCLKADAGRDTTIKTGDSVFIGSYTNGIDTLRWLNANTNTVIDSIQPGFWVKPTASTTYILYQIVNGCPSSDTVNVMVQPLPLKFTMYDVRCMNVGCGSSPRGNERSVENIWQTANEIKVSHFNIQRSIDGIHFETIGKVVAINNSYNEYNFIDDKLPNTNDQLTIYYRLQNVDKDGKLNYSTIKQITINKKQETVLVYPNPAKDVVNVYCKEGIKEVRVFNVLGKKVYQQSINCFNQLSLNINHYLKGLYLIEITTKNNAVFHEKLLVQ